jgi:predicted nucleic acid-binding protein
LKLVDSSGWIQYLSDGPLAEEYLRHLSPLDGVITPTVVLYEVYKWVKRERSEEDALTVAAQVGRTRVVPLTSPIVLAAGDLSLAHGLAMADALVYATAIHEGAELVSSDADLEDLPGVLYLPRS